MPEISLVKGLTGREAMESMLFELRKKLALHGRFGGNMNYAGYRAEITVKFYPAAMFVPPVDYSTEIDEVPPGATVSETATVEETVKIPVRPPNQVREESDMPKPFLTQDEHGHPVEVWKKKPGAPPKNKVKGGNVGKEPAQTMVPTAIPPDVA